MYGGASSGYELGILIFGGSFGGNLPENNTPQDGFGNFGYQYYEGGIGGGLSGGPKIGGWWSKTNTIIFH
ncbi:MAG: hypothetical protein CVU09_01500 [Bacteroidetes bacterium HGW-Bacteroidetes-4]|jgi:hypothetical protein|nr:MAG: hypothetical protein CVU09_01500 [Bacteroidetes bacterium HGW-Bacteroidetes-4]